MTLAELIAEAKRLDEAATFADRESVPWEEFADASARRDTFYAEHGPRLARVAEKTLSLFATLDLVAPRWREYTCAIDGDEVNRAWVELEKELGQGPDAAAGGDE